MLKMEKKIHIQLITLIILDYVKITNLTFLLKL